MESGRYDKGWQSEFKTKTGYFPKLRILLKCIAVCCVLMEDKDEDMKEG